MSQHPLATWIEKHSTVADLASLVECSPSHLRNIIAGRKEASLPLAVKLSEATGGAIPEAAFLRPQEVAA